MKRLLTERIFALALAMMLLFTAAAESTWICEFCGAYNLASVGDVCPNCGQRHHAHVWQDASCTAPQTCTICGETRGEKLSHAWQNASCDAPVTCVLCGETAGKALGHLWLEASCTVPRTCARCGLTSGDALGHSWREATCEVPKTCTRCGIVEGTVTEHLWSKATCFAPATCALCGRTQGEKLRPMPGDIVEFGHYEQDNDATNGKEPIEWIVIYKRDNGIIGLMSKYALDAKPYNMEYTDVTWEKCTLRKWLNEEFYNAAFSVKEQAKIVTTWTININNPLYGTTGGNLTEDKVWLLTTKDVMIENTSVSVYSYFTDNISLMCAPTKYAQTQGAWQSSDNTVDGAGTCWWWLRSPGYESRLAAYVGNDGNVDCYGFSVHVERGVRPVVNVRP